MSEWKNIHIGEICSSISNSFDMNIEKVILINTSDIFDGKILNHTKVENRNLKGQFKKTFQKDDILYSEIRPANRHFAYVDIEDTRLYVASTKIMVLRPNKAIIDSQFLYAILSSKSIIAELQHLAETRSGTFPQITFVSELASITIKLPDMQTQKRVSTLLRIFDEKINILRQINHNLWLYIILCVCDAILAIFLFICIFIDYERLNHNLEEQIKTLCNAWLSKYIPFGGSMPPDWSYTKLSDIAEFVSGYSYKSSELTHSNIAMATIKNFERKGGFKLDGYKEIIPSSKLKEAHYIKLFDLLVAHTDLTQNAEVIGNVELVMSTSIYTDIIFSMDLVKVCPKKQISKFLIAALLQTKKFKTHCLGYVNGTTVLHLSKKALSEYTVMLPQDIGVLKPLDDLITGLYMQIAQNTAEISALTALRDTLLPKLMSGEIDVSAVEIGR